MTYETVAGLEVHVELSTRSKIFCGCATAFGGEPNTHVCPVCTGMPGVLPVLNERVVEFAVRTGLALGCSITRHNKFDRKNYFYPDLPKAYQVSQLYLPICREGKMRIETPQGELDIGIHEIHMEEDAGKLIHDPFGDCTLVDYNRCGVPLLEIVTEPDFRSADQVIAFLEKLRETLSYLGVSDCKMQEGSIRADVNVSVRPLGTDALGTRTEMKNMNSLKAIHRAVLYEARRQIELTEAGERVTQETRRWDENKDRSFPMRSKEDAQDYRYFPEPDLLPVEIGDELIQSVSRSMPELAPEKRARYKAQYGLSDYDAGVLTSAREWARLFEETARLCGQPKEAANLIMVELMRLSGEAGIAPEDLRVDAKKLSAVITMIVQGRINRTVAKEVVERVFAGDIDPEAYVDEHNLAMTGDLEVIGRAVDKAMAANGESVAAYRGGKEKVFAFLVGQVMKELRGKADPKAVNQALRAWLEDR